MDKIWLTVGPALLGLCAGASFVVQQALNASLRASLRSASWAAFISYAGGTITMLVIMLMTREAWLAPSLIAKTSWLAWTGGFFGVVYIMISILLVPRLGAATVVALLVAGQMLTSLALDHFGVLGLDQHPLNAARAIGAALLVAGAVLLRF